MQIKGIVNYYEAAAQFELTAEEAFEFFLQKGLSRSFRWDEMVRNEHDVAFTVAKLMNGDLLDFVKKELTKVIDSGETFKDFADKIAPALQRHGWWGKRDVLEPYSGQVIEARLGSASRLETIFRTNLQSAYAKGQWQSIEENMSSMPYLMFDAVDDSRTRPEHARLDGIVLPVGHSFWDTHKAPLDYNCRCGVIQMSWEDLQDYGLQVSDAPNINWQTYRTPDGREITHPQGVGPTFI
ncbi:phage minor head protein [Idiomarina sp.]|uniref:phage head morphogenesis protein n=1 Tax=Idiomarina sp. TaxID=1874361 RepID=UPI0025C639F5|nr:phage minor head protein [Idiomarina sp.]